MPGQEKSFLLYAKNGEVGFKIDDNLVVTVIQKGSMADGKIQVGHKILRVNNQVIITKAQFEKAIREHSGQGVTIFVWHDKDQVKHAREQQPKAKEGYEIKEIVIVWNPISQQKLGLAVKGDGMQVYITNVAENSVCSLYLSEGDRVVSIDGWPVGDKEMARNLLVQAFRINNRAALIIERPIEENTKSAVSNVLTAASNQDPSVIMQSDVMEIMQKQMTKLEQNDDQKLKGLYKETSTNGPKKKSKDSSSLEEKGKSGKKPSVQIKDTVRENVIGQDNSAIAALLRPVPPKTGPSGAPPPQQ